MVTSRGSRVSARGFSLIELLVVMFIIGLVVAITIPALGYARTLAKKTTTMAFINGLSQACTHFQTDNRRVPGYFSPREMGDVANVATGATGGFTAMDNVLLDLSGGVTTAAANGTSIFAFGPNTSKVNVDIDRIGTPGAAAKIYWAPDAKYYEAQTNVSKVGDSVNLNIKSVVDAFGQPLLFWATDEASLAPITPTSLNAFANVAYGQNGATSSKYYWASNSAFLSSSALGKRGRDQTSLSMFGTAQAANHTKFMTAYLGNPSAIANPSDPQASWIPSSGRGKFMIHSAGQDGVFLSTEDNGYKKNGGTALNYSSNFPVGSNKPADIAGDFDDLLVSGGN